jgi:hypothetical protein
MSFRDMRTNLLLNRGRFVFLNESELYTTFKTNGHGSKIAMLQVVFEGAPIFKSSTYTIMKEKVISDYIGLMMPLNHFMFDVFNYKMIQLQESGIMQRLMKFSYPKANTTEEDPVPLSIGHLLIWYQLWVALLLISTFFFFVEVLVSKMKNRKQKIHQENKRPQRQLHVMATVDSFKF